MYYKRGHGSSTRGNKGLIRVHLSFLTVKSVKSVSIENIQLKKSDFLLSMTDKTCYIEKVYNCCGPEQVQPPSTAWVQKVAAHSGGGAGFMWCYIRVTKLALT